MERFDEAGNQNTYLSAYVENLVCYQNNDIIDRNNLISTNNGLFDWSATELCDIVQSCSQNNDINYEQAVIKLHSLCEVIHHHLIQYTIETFYEKYEPYLTWSNKKDHILSCFHLLKSNNTGHIEAALLLLTSCTEQILGDIYLTCSTINTPQCPSSLKDLLETAELNMALGNNLLFCLKCYIASPLGLNLRNLAWHGFLSNGELQLRHVSFLLMCVLSFCEETKRNLRTGMELKERCLISYNATSAVLLENYFPFLQTEQLRTLFRSCSFVTKSMDYMWYLAVEWYEQDRFGDVIMILLPQLEHSLRRVFCCSNNLQERLQTAESSELYTTFNEIFSFVLSDNSSNKFQEIIGEQFMEILFDLFVYQEGPRLRDHISHGEVDLKTFPKYLTNHVFSVCVAFCVAFSREKLTLLDNEYYQQVMKAVENYSSFYHPLSCLKRTCISYIMSLQEWRQIPKPCDEDLLKSTENTSEDDQIKCRRVMENILTSNIMEGFETRGLEDLEIFYADILQFLNEANLPTLFRPRYELETISLLRNILKQSLTASNKIKETAEERFSDWKERKLRSRQRNTYQRLLSNISFINNTMNLVLLIVLIEITNIHDISRDHDRKIKFLKRCLQFTENLYNFSLKNRWLECLNIAKILMNQTESYFQTCD